MTGYDVGGWSSSVWIPHAMYETTELLDDLTHDDLMRTERAAREEPAGLPRGPEEVRHETWVIDAHLPDLFKRFARAASGEEVEHILMNSGARLIGSTLGPSAAPGDGWQRLMWSELAKRLDHDPWALDVAPCHRSFPYRSWPANIRPPAGGSLDKEQLERLVEHLAAVTPGGLSAACFALFAAVGADEYDEKMVYAGRLGGVPALYDQGQLGPANIWADGRHWLTYSDYDLWATRIDGPEELIGRLRNDPEIETVTLPHEGRPRRLDLE